ncbi:unnamed protein product [Chrysodeixis includens]|uniref:Ninjurin-1 n=1 Tax=Chrysodeixis includens TaxID=689277 RepID=A0A9P0FWD8_CHRIL|nr:unnamed protein product [Chrysodeixis includens]
MANDHVKLDIINEKHKDVDTDAIEIVFGRPAPAHPKQTHTNNANLIDSERGHNDMHFNNLNESDMERPTQPLLDHSKERTSPPLAESEIDDLDGDPPSDATPYRGIDDGLLDSTDTKLAGHDLEGDEHHPELSAGADEKHPDMFDEGAGTDGNLPSAYDEPDYPYDVNGLSTRFGESRPTSAVPVITPDVNTYQQKKNLAQGMMDLALLSANANQLRYVLESASTHPYYYPSLAFISLSIIFQVLVGIGLILNSRYDVNHHKDICKADKINNMTVLGVFLITIVNVFITSFGVATQPPPQTG